MAREEKPSYYAILTASVRYDKDLNFGTRLLYAEITALSNVNGKCWAGDDYFMSLYEVSKRTIQSWLKSLEDKGYISREVVYKKGTKEIEKRFITLTHETALPYSRNMRNPIAEICVDNTTSNNTTSSNIKPMVDFDKFWELYPNKKAKGQAIKKFSTAVKDKETYDLIIEDLNNRHRCKDWQKEKGKYIPHPSTYLNAMGWLDEYETVNDRIVSGARFEES